MRLPNGFGSVHKLSGNRRKPYRVRITVGWKESLKGKKVQVYKNIGYYATKKEGMMALAKFNRKTCMLYNEMTFEELYNVWSNEHYKKIVPSSRRIWIAAYKHSSQLYSKVFNQLKVFDLENTINDANVGNATKIRMKGLYNMMYKYAIKHEITDKNYAEYCDIPKVETKIIRTTFTKEEIEKLWQNISVPFVDMILINIYSGLRPRELVELETGKVDLKNRIMQGGLKTEAGKDRIVPIHSKIFSLISKRYNIYNSRLFLKEDGNVMTYDDYRNRFIKIMKKLDMDHKPHDARHTFITLAKLCQVDEYIIKLIVGHKIADITENIYTHRDFDLIKIEIEKIK